MRETIVGFAIVWGTGCILAYAILKLCGVLDKENKLSSAPLTMGVSFSWLLVAYFGLIMFRGYKLKKSVIEAQEKVKKVLNRMNDSELIKQTIDDYWVPATMYGAEFDPEPELPIRDSKLCKVYYDTPDKLLDGYKLHCRHCPIDRAGFGCTAVGFHLKYQKSTPENRKRAAMILGKVFGDIYEEVKSKEGYSRR